jgi:hypothetical protein
VKTGVPEASFTALFIEALRVRFATHTRVEPGFALGIKGFTARIEVTY